MLNVFEDYVRVRSKEPTEDLLVVCIISNTRTRSDIVL